MAARTWTFSSKSNPNAKPYEVMLREADGRLSCNCRGWAIRKGDKVRACSHTDEVRATVPGVWQVLGDAHHLMGDVAPALEEQAPMVKETVEVDLTAFTSKYYNPMLASGMPTGLTVDSFPDGQWAMEEKYDGHRVTVRVQDGAVQSWSRPGPGAGTKPGLVKVLHPRIVTALAFLPNGYYDGELVVPEGKSWDVSTLENAARLVYVIFDVCEMLGHSTVNEPYSRRRQYLDAISESLAAEYGADGPVAVSPMISVSRATVEDIWSRGGEGVVLKRLDAKYQPGCRSDQWIKVKAIHEDTFRVTGFEAGSFGPHSVLLMERVSDGKKTRTKNLNNEWLRRCAAGGIALGTEVEVEYQVETASAFRHPMVKRVVGEE